MQYPAMFQPMKPQFPEKEKLKCPRCESTNTKFCYYNNYNLSQPRHFCKNCRRYWTKGGTLRNIPVGGGTRKNTKKSKSSNIKRSSSFSTSSVSTTSTAQVSDPQSDPTRNCDPIVEQDRQMLETPGSFSSTITSNGQFASLLEGVNPNMSAFKMLQMSELGDNVNLGTQLNTVSGRNPVFEVQFSNGSQSYLGLQNGDSNCWSGDNGWPDLSIYARGSSHQ